jgi:hypothetical protein
MRRQQMRIIENENRRSGPRRNGSGEEPACERSLVCGILGRNARKWAASFSNQTNVRGIPQRT